jgi:ABC-2 type transport system permease protein
MRGEPLILVRDSAVWIVSVSLSLLMLGSLANGHRFVAAQERTRQSALEDEARAYRARRADVVSYELQPPAPVDPTIPNLSDPRNPYAVGQAGRIATLPLDPLALTSIGQFDLLPLQDNPSIRTRQRTVADKYGLENPLGLLAGRFDAAFVVIYLLPLLLIAVTYNLVSLEREQGTLALLAVQPVGLRRILLRKLALRSAAILLPAGIVMVAALAAWSGPWQRDTPLRLLSWLLIVGIYAAFWLGLAAWINTRRLASTTNAILLVSVWLLFVGVIPSALNVVVNVLRPAPSRLELLAAIRDRSIDQRRDGKHLAEQFYADHPELARSSGVALNTNVTGTMTHIEQDRRTLPLEREFESRLLAQQQLVRRVRFVSPAIVVQEAFNDLAGTSLFRYQHFRDQVRTFREQWISFFHPLIFGDAELHPADYDRMPKFAYRHEPSNQLEVRIASSILGLLFPASLACLIALWKLVSV